MGSWIFKRWIFSSAHQVLPISIDHFLNFGKEIIFRKKCHIFKQKKCCQTVKFEKFLLEKPVLRISRTWTKKVRDTYIPSFGANFLIISCPIHIVKWIPSKMSHIQRCSNWKWVIFSAVLGSCQKKLAEWRWFNILENQLWLL